MPTTRRLLYFSLTMLALVAGLFFVPRDGAVASSLSKSSSSMGAQSLKARQVDALLSRVEQRGSLRVIVELDVAFTPEGGLGSAFDRRLQRSAIARAQARLADRIMALDGRVLRRFQTVPLLTLEAGEVVLADLAENDAVTSVQEDVPAPAALFDSVPLIGGSTAWGMGYSGAGQLVAIIDSGVDGEHEFLAGKVISEIEACFSTISAGYGSSSLCPNGFEEQTGEGAAVNCDTAIEGCSHGTHVAGIAAGSGSSFSGVAREAEILAVQVFSRFEGSTCTDYGLSSPCILTFSSDQIAALEWVYEQREDYSIAAANMSLGDGEFSSACDSDARKPIIDTLRSAGIATVVSAGNSGYREALGAPACISSAVSVGSTTKFDDVSSFSNIAPTLSLLAPGSAIYASVPGDGYAYFSGTSMAAPHISGAWAVLKSKVPDESVDALLAALQDSGELLDDQRSDGVVVDLARVQLDQALDEFDRGTATPSVTATWTATASPTSTPTATATPSPTPTSTFTPTPTSTDTPSPTASRTPTATSTPTPSSTPTATAGDEPTATSTSESGPAPQDLNQDGRVDVLDVQLCVNVFLGVETEDALVALADVNEDGQVDVLDVQAIVNTYLQG